MEKGRVLHQNLEIDTPYRKWFRRMCEYGFEESKDFNSDKNVRVQNEFKMNELMVINSDQFGSIRTITKDGDPWFVAADVCRALELDDTWRAIQRLEEDEKGTSSIRTPGGTQEMSVVNEPGLYALVLGSRKPDARAFKRWITHKVIPDIRRYGLYATHGVIESMLAIWTPRFAITCWLYPASYGST